MRKKIIQIGNISCGADPLFLIAGPCVIEEEFIMMQVAEYLKNLSEKFNLPVIYKSSFQKDNRSALQYYQGPGIDKGLKLLEKIKATFGFPILSDIHYPAQVEQAAAVLDIIQIPAYLCMQTELITKAAATKKVINLKHGQFLAPENMCKPVQKIVDSGNHRIMLTERGYTFGYNDLIVDPRSFYQLRQMGYPVIFDITHTIRKYGIPSADPKGGSPEFLPTIARAGVAAGIDGLFIEIHPHPQKARCDAASQMRMDKLEEFLQPLLAMHKVAIQYM